MRPILVEEESMAGRKKLDEESSLSRPPRPPESMLLGVPSLWPAQVSCNFDTGGGGRWNPRHAAFWFISLVRHRGEGQMEPPPCSLLVHISRAISSRCNGIPAFLSWPRTHPHARWSCAMAAKTCSRQLLMCSRLPPFCPRPSVLGPAPRQSKTLAGRRPESVVVRFRVLPPPLGPKPSVCRPAARRFETDGYDLWWSLLGLPCMDHVPASMGVCT